MRTVITQRDVPRSSKLGEDPEEYGYPEGYQALPLITQIELLQKRFPNLKTFDITLFISISKGNVPDGAEGWFAIPRWRAIASTYVGAVGKVLDMIEGDRDNGFYNSIECKLDARHFRQTRKSAKFFARIAREQEHKDILFIPAQFGSDYVDLPVRWAREKMGVGEFALGLFAVATMTLVHPQRFVTCNDLWIACSGDEYASSGDGFNSVPVLGIGRHNRLRLGVRWGGDGKPDCGIPTGFSS